MSMFAIHRYCLASLLMGLLATLSLLPADAETTLLRGQVTQDTAMVQAMPPQQPGIVGLHFQIRPGESPFILEVYPGTPAQKAGLQPGDEVLAIDSLSTRGMSRSEVDEAISDVPGVRVRFLVSRHGQVFPVTLAVVGLSQVPSRGVRSLFGQVLSP